MKKALLLLGGILILFGGVLVFAGHRGGMSQPTTTDRTTREVALTCTTDMATEFHIHPHLSIVINGQAEVIPANVGITPTCMKSIHTHTPDGVLHVESPEKRDFTLGDFFAVWEKSFSKDEVMGYKVDATHKIRVLVNGKEVDTYENTILYDQEQIVITYGS